jgi:hypothetical protein
MAEKELNGADVVGQLFGKRQRVAYQTGDTRPSRVIEALDVIGFAGFLRDGTVLRCWDHALIDGILVGMKQCLFPVHQGDLGPERRSTLVAAIPHGKGNDLTGRRIHRNPNPPLTP